MIKVLVDFSIFTQEQKSFGSVSGSIDLIVAPMIGDKIWFTATADDIPFPLSGFGGYVTVERRMLTANSENGGLLIMLSDLILPTENDARAVAEYLESGFGLFVDVNDDD